MYAKEIESKTGLEQLLRLCVDDVKAEISKKRSENKVMYCKCLLPNPRWQQARQQSPRTADYNQ